MKTPITLEQIAKRLDRIEDVLMERIQPSSDWISERQAAKEFGYSLSGIRRLRYAGTFTRIRGAETGRKIMLSRKELQGKLRLKVA